MVSATQIFTVALALAGFTSAHPRLGARHRHIRRDGIAPAPFANTTAPAIPTNATTPTEVPEPSTISSTPINLVTGVPDAPSNFTTRSGFNTVPSITASVDLPSNVAGDDTTTVQETVTVSYTLGNGRVVTTSFLKTVTKTADASLPEETITDITTTLTSTDLEVETKTRTHVATTSRLAGLTSEEIEEAVKHAKQADDGSGIGVLEGDKELLAEYSSIKEACPGAKTVTVALSEKIVTSYVVLTVTVSEKPTVEPTAEPEVPVVAPVESATPSESDPIVVIPTPSVVPPGVFPPPGAFPTGTPPTGTNIAVPPFSNTTTTSESVSKVYVTQTVVPIRPSDV